MRKAAVTFFFTENLMKEATFEASFWDNNIKMDFYYFITN